METREILDQALLLKPADKFSIIEGLNRDLENIWADEAQKRLEAYREGALEGVPLEDVFGEMSAS